jgi:hypothetical protein
MVGLACGVYTGLAPLTAAIGHGQPAGTTQSSNGADDAKPLDLTFDDLKFDIEKDQAFDPALLTDAIKALEQRRVTLSGYILPTFKQSDIKNFILVRDNQECCFGPGAALYDCVLVSLEEGRAIDYTVRPIEVEGTFFLKEFVRPDPNDPAKDRVFAVFRLKDATVH